MLTPFKRGPTVASGLSQLTPRRLHKNQKLRQKQTKQKNSKPKGKEFTTYRVQGLWIREGYGEERDRVKQETERKGREEWEAYVRTSWGGQYSPRTMGYRTWFYVAFVCAYACCPCADRTDRARCGRAPADSRSCWARSLVRSSCQLPKPLRAHGPGLDCVPRAGNLHSSADRMAADLQSGCRSWDKWRVVCSAETYHICSCEKEN